VHLNRLSLHRYRNLAEATLEFSPGLNLVVGRNGQGKTNLLEAIHLLALAHSPRARSERDCIAWTQKTFVLRGEGQALSGVMHAQSMEYGEDGIRVKVNGKESRRLSSLLGAFALVSFSPEDLELVRGGPMVRRRFLDVLLCQMEPDYLDVLRHYQAAMKQRNAGLRENVDAGILAAYEQGMAESGANIVFRRESLLAALKPWAQGDYSQLSRGGEALGLRMTRNSNATDASDANSLAAALLEALRRNRDRDREEGGTSVGPHRDDLMLFLAGKSARDFGSQGQKRSVALSLRMAAAQLLRERLRLPPILLLDDVFAELDAERQAALGELLRERGQAFIATPRQGEMPFAVDATFQVEAGKVERS
jgi:DNA replication and repair protein RecF